MRWAPLFVASLFVVATFAGIPTNMGFDHVGFTVPSTQQAADFLMDMFDCKFDWEVKRDPLPNAGERGWARLFNIHNESYMPHVMMLKCGDYHLTQYVELFEWASPDQKTYPEKDNYWLKFTDIGHGYISFTVKDIYAVLDHIKSKKDKYPTVRIIQDPPMQFPLRGEICTSTFIISPWGQWIELTMWSESGPKGEVLNALQPKKEDEAFLSFVAEPEGESDIAPSNMKALKQHPAIGKSILEVETPALFVDLEKFEYNVNLLTKRIKEKGLHWRPPVKAHKCPGLVKLMLGAGAEGIVVLTLAEAEGFAKQGIDDIYLANQVVDPSKMQRLIELAKRTKRLRIAVDDSQNLIQLASSAKHARVTLEILVEININHNRTGVKPEQAVELAKLASHLQMETRGAIKFVGITGYEGHTPVLAPEDKTRETKISHGILAKAKTLIEESGLQVEVVSGGGSSNYVDALATDVLTELQSGGATLNDLLYLHKAGLAAHGHVNALFLLTQITSVSIEKDRAMGDAGFKTSGWHPFGGYPQPYERTDIEVIGLSAEHVKIKPIPADSPINLARGDKVVLLPGYGDAIGFLHKRIYAVRNGVVQDVWFTLNAEAPSDYQ